jgi:hypothetical protein
MSGVREDDRKTTYGLNTGPEADTRNTRRTQWRTLKLYRLRFRTDLQWLQHREWA